MRYITFYTRGFYETVYNKYLKPSAEAVGVDIRAYVEHNYTDWALNTKTKAKVILRALNEWDEIVWLDADATLVSYPTLLENIPKEYDMALFYLDWFKQWRGEEGNAKRELVNSVMVLRNTEKTMSVINEWISNNDVERGCDQDVLTRIVERRTDLNIYRLPDPYCAIIDFTGKVPDYVKDPVIIQNQISRVAKAMERRTV